MRVNNRYVIYVVNMGEECGTAVIRYKKNCQKNGYRPVYSISFHAAKLIIIHLILKFRIYYIDVKRVCRRQIKNFFYFCHRQTTAKIA